MAKRQTVAQVTARVILTDLYEAWCNDGGRGFTVARLSEGITLADTILTIAAAGPKPRSHHGDRNTGDVLFEAAQLAGADLGNRK